MDKAMNNTNTPTATCPFCEGEGCCNCDHSGRVPYGEGQIFKTREQAENHDPEISLFDLRFIQSAKGLT